MAKKKVSKKIISVPKSPIKKKKTTTKKQTPKTPETKPVEVVKESSFFSNLLKKLGLQ